MSKNSYKNKIRRKNIIRIWIFLILLSSIFWLWKYYENNIKESSWVSFLIKNNSWNSQIWEDTPYIKWDEIELLYFWKWDAKVDLRNISDNIKIKEVLLWDKKIEINNQEIEINNIDNKPIKIIWKALKDKKDTNINYKKIIETEKKNISDIEKNQDDINIEEELINKDEKIDDKIIDERSEDISKEEIDKKMRVENLKILWNWFYPWADNLLELSWDNLEEIKFLTIWKSSFSPILKDWKVLFLIEKNIFDKWEYFWLLQTNSWLITLDETINFIWNIKQNNDYDIEIINITPNIITDEKLIVLQWEGFSKVVSIQFSNNIVIKKADFRIINDKVMSIALPKEIEKWEYYLNIMTTENIIQFKDSKFTIK